MRELKYYCNECKKQVDDKKHLSITFGGWSGYVEKKANGKYKHIQNSVSPHTTEPIKQFCNTRCLGKYFKKPSNYKYL